MAHCVQCVWCRCPRDGGATRRCSIPRILQPTCAALVALTLDYGGTQMVGKKAPILQLVTCAWTHHPPTLGQFQSHGRVPSHGTNSCFEVWKPHGHESTRSPLVVCTLPSIFRLNSTAPLLTTPLVSRSRQFEWGFALGKSVVKWRSALLPLAPLARALLTV